MESWWNFQQGEKVLMDYSVKHIEEIYKKAMITRHKMNLEQQKRLEIEVEKNFWGYVHPRMQRLLEQIVGMDQVKTISQKQTEDAKREFAKLNDLLLKSTIPEVINQLTMDLTREKNLIKLENAV